VTIPVIIVPVVNVAVAIVPFSVYKIELFLDVGADFKVLMFIMRYRVLRILWIKLHTPAFLGVV